MVLQNNTTYKKRQSVRPVLHSIIIETNQYFSTASFYWEQMQTNDANQPNKAYIDAIFGSLPVPLRTTECSSSLLLLLYS